MKRCAKLLLSAALVLLVILAVFPLATPVSAVTTVTQVRATVSTPIEGYTISKTNDCFTPTEGVTITDMNWTNADGVIYPSNTTFQTGVTYYCDIEFTVEDGYSFPNSYTQLTGKINGKVGEISTVYYTDHAYVTVPFTPIRLGEIYVGGIGMNDGDYLRVGSEATSKTKPSDRYAYYKDGVLTLHNYTYQGTGLVLPGAYSYYSSLVYGERSFDIVVEGRCDLSSTSDARYGEGIYFASAGEESSNTIKGSSDSLLQITVPHTAISSQNPLKLTDCYISIKNTQYGIGHYDDLWVENSTLNMTTDRLAWKTVGNVKVANSKLDITSAQGIGMQVRGDISFDDVTADITSEFTAISVSVDSKYNNSADVSIFNSILTVDSKESNGVSIEESLTIHSSTVNTKSKYDCFFVEKGFSIVSSDITAESLENDGFYCASGNMFITSSEVNISAAGNDGIQFNGERLYITSSYVYILQPGDSGIECWADKLLSIADSTLALGGDYGLYTESATTIENSTVKAAGGKYGILSYEANITITDSEIEATAIHYSALEAKNAKITFGDGLIAQASVQIDGKPEIYDSAKADTYRWAKVVKADPVSITTQPKTSHTKLGQTAKTTVKASGDGLTYTWYVKRTGASKFKKAVATTATYSLKMNATNKNASVYCVVTDQYGYTAQSEIVQLLEAVSITTQPKIGYAKLGKNATVSVKASGDGLTYTWYVKKAGASKYSKTAVTTATYSLKMTATNKNASVYCVVKDQYGNTAQSKAVLLRQSVSIATQPKTGYAKLGQTAKVSVKASGDGLTYTWYVKKAGATKYTKAAITTSTYSLKITAANKNASVYCVVKDQYGNTVQSNKVQLREAVSIVTQPKPVTAEKNTTAKVSVKASGDGLTYTWYMKNAGASKYTKTAVTKSIYSVKMTAKVHNRMVYCVVTDAYGNTVKSAAVRLRMK